MTSAGSTDLPGDPLAEVLARIAAARGVHRRLRGVGYLHIERPLPFLAVGTEKLVTTLPAYLSIDARTARPKLGATVRRLAASLAARSGTALVLEVRAAAHARGEAPSADAPSFRIFSGAGAAFEETAGALAAALAEIRVGGQPASVALLSERADAPLLVPPVPNVYEVLLEIEPIYRSRDGAVAFPLVMAELKEQLDRALRKTFVTFARGFAAAAPADAQAFARRRVLKAARDVDRRLTHASNSLRYLYLVTPTNTEEAFREFAAGGFERAPSFVYRPIDFDPQLLKREIYAIPLERVEDPTLIAIFREKQLELDRLVTLLVDRNTERFRWGSLQLFGGVNAHLQGLSQQILERTAGSSSVDDEAGPQIRAEAFAELARRELDHYRTSWPELAPQIVVRDDVPGLLVVNGALVIGKNVGLTSGRARALIEHEIGTHLVTFYNGSAQRLHHLGSGLAGYEALQEGLAVLAEYLVGGLTPGRLRLIAARVIAVASMLKGDGFVETYRSMQELGLAPRTAFTVAMRVHRGGGLSKDAIYLRGLEQVMGYLAAGGEVDDLLVGKVSMQQLPLIRELRLRGVIRPPRLRPRWSTDPEARRRLSSLVRGATLLDLLKEDPCVLPSS